MAKSELCDNETVRWDQSDIIIMWKMNLVYNFSHRIIFSFRLKTRPMRSRKQNPIKVITMRSLNLNSILNIGLYLSFSSNRQVPSHSRLERRSLWSGKWRRSQDPIKNCPPVFLSVDPSPILISDPLPQKGYKVAGADTSYSQKSEGQSLCPALDAHNTNGRNFSIFWDMSLIRISNETELFVRHYCAYIPKVIKST